MSIKNNSLSYGTMHRIPRVSPDVALKYKQWTIPPGVSMNSNLTDMYIFYTNLKPGLCM